MLLGISPILSGDLLRHLDAMGHSDAVAVVDAHFPAHRLATRLVELPTLGSPEVLAAIASVVPPDVGDDLAGLDLMQNAEGTVLAVQQELISAAGLSASDVRFVERFMFYDLAESAFLIVRTGETRVYGNALLRKGVVPSTPANLGVTRTHTSATGPSIAGSITQEGS